MAARIQNVLVLGDDRFPRHRRISRFLFEAGEKAGVHVITRDVSALWEAFETIKEESEEERQLGHLGLVDQLMKMILGFEVDHVISLDASSLLVPAIFLQEGQPKFIHHLWLHPLNQILEFWNWDSLHLGSWQKPLAHDKCRHYFMQDTLQILPGMVWSFLRPGAPRRYVDLDPQPKQIGRIACELDPSYLPEFNPDLLARLKWAQSRFDFLVPFDGLRELDRIPYLNLWYLYHSREDLDIFGAVDLLKLYEIEAKAEIDRYEKNLILSRYRAHLHLMNPVLLGAPYERIPESMAMGSVPILLSSEFYVSPWTGVVVVSGESQWNTVLADFKDHPNDWHLFAQKHQIAIENEGLWEHRLKTIIGGAP